jgi:broad specificity phosphatase PhoE
LIERDFGIMTGKNVADILNLTDRVLITEKINYFLEVEGAEDFPTLLLRAKNFLDYVNDRYPDKTVLAVTHGDIGKMVQAAFHGWEWEESLKGPYFANTGVLHLARIDVVE